MGRWATATALLALCLFAVALMLATGPAGAQQITTDTEYKDENLVFTEDVEVAGGARLTLKGCDITFKPPGSLPLYLRVVSGSLEIFDTDLVGEGSGFIVLSAGDTTIRNVTATGLGAVANSSLTARGLPLAAQGGFMFYDSKVTVFNLDISGAPATALYAEDCDLDVFSLGTRDACTAYRGTDQCAAVAITYLGTPFFGSTQRTAVINGSKVQTSANHGILVAAAATGYDVNVTIEGTEISTSAGSGLVVYEVNSHGVFNVEGDTNDIHHSTLDGVLWVRKSASGNDATLDLKKTRIYSIEGTAFRVIATGSRGAATLKLDSCTITDTKGHGVAVTSTGCTQSLNVTLVDSTFSAPGGSGLYFTTDGDGKTSDYHMRLLGTKLDSSGSYGIYTKVSQSYAQFNLTLIGSEVTGSRSDGIRMEYSLTYFTYLEAPSVTSNLTVSDSLLADNGGYGIYDTRYLRSYYSWAQAKATLHAAVNVLGSTIRNHTRSAVVITPTSQLQYVTYTSEGFVTDSTFVNNSGHGYFEKVDSLTAANGGTTRVGWHVSGSSFRELTHSGVYIDLRRADSATILFDVSNCTFTDLGDNGVILYASSSTYVGKVVARLQDCTMTDLGGHAYYLWPGRPGTMGGDQRAFLKSVRAHNTTGVHVYFDGYALEDYYRLVLEKVNVTHTRGDAIDINVHPYQSARMDTVLRDIFVRNTNGTALSIMYTSDRNQPLWGQLTGENITLLDQQVGGFVLYEHTGSITDLTIKSSVEFDMHKVDNRIPLDGTGIMELHSASMDRRKVKVVGEGALWVFNALSVKVEWQNGMAALGAGVQVQDRTFQVVAVGHVEGEHGMDPVELLAYILDSQEFRSRSPFIVNITFLDLEQTGVCSLDEPSTVLIVVHDRVAPSVVILEPDDGSSQRASYFELRGSAFDAHAGLHQIRYRIDGGQWVDIGSSSPFRTTVQDVEPGEHMLEIDVFDRAGNLASEVIRIEIDNQPPRLVVVSPEGDILTRNPDLVVRGETEDGATVSINGEEVDTLHGLFIAEVRLQEGPNTVTVVSLDRLSNVATVRFIATLDTVEPFLDVQSHEDGDWVSSNVEAVSGIVEAGCTLTIDGVPASVDDLNFTALVNLKEGDNNLLLRAEDPAGNIYTVELTLYVSTDEPWLNLESPGDDALYSQHEVRVMGTVQPGSTVTINGRLVTIKQGLVDELLILPEGMSTITIEVIDPAENIHTRTVQVTVDTIDPVLTIDPLPDRTRESQLTVTGVAEGATILFLGDASIPLEEDGSFSVNVTLLEGTNSLDLLCRDGAGHEDRATAHVVRDSTPPFLRLALPGLTDDGNGTWYSNKRTVTLQVVSEPGASITLNGVYILVGEDGTANVDVTLEGVGQSTIVRVLVVDDLGNSEDLQYNIVYEGPSSQGSSVDWLSLLSTIVIMVLLVAMVVLVARYNTLVKKMSARRRRPPRRKNGHRPPGSGNSGNGGNGGKGNGGGPL
jgi:hypothetical protein